MCPSRNNYKPLYDIPTSYRGIISDKTTSCICRVLLFSDNKKLDYFFLTTLKHLRLNCYFVYNLLATLSLKLKYYLSNPRLR